MGREAVGCLWSTMGALCSLLNRLWRTHRGPCAALWNLPGFYNGLYLPRCQRNRHHISPSLTLYIEEFLLTDVCWFLRFPQVFTDRWLLSCHQIMSASQRHEATPKFKRCLCSEKRFTEWVRAHFISFCPVSVFTSLACVGSVNKFLLLILTWYEKPLKLRDSTCQLTKNANQIVFN